MSVVYQITDTEKRRTSRLSECKTTLPALPVNDVNYTLQNVVGTDTIRQGFEKKAIILPAILSWNMIGTKRLKNLKLAPRSEVTQNSSSQNIVIFRDMIMIHFNYNFPT